MIKHTPNHVVHECLNCGNHFHGDFCNGCGQRVMPRFTAIYLWKRVTEDIIGVESGLFLTFKELWLKPGEMISNYISGATGRYYGPLKYLIFWIALYLLSLSFATGIDQNADVLQYLAVWANNLLSSASSQETVRFIMRLAQQQTNFYLTGMIPVFSVFGLLFFKRKDFNLTELVIFYAYFYGQFSFCGLLTNLFNVFPWVKESGLPTLMLFILYFFLFFRMQTQFFNLRSGASLLKGTALILVSTGVYWFILAVIFNLMRV